MAHGPSVPDLPSLRIGSYNTQNGALDEKLQNSPTTEKTKDAEVVDKMVIDGSHDGDSKVEMVNGEPVINSGADISRFVVDLRDDGDPPFTLRSVVLGTIAGGLGAALYQVRPLSLPLRHILTTISRSTASSPSRKLSLPSSCCSSSTLLVFSGQRPSQDAVGWTGLDSSDLAPSSISSILASSS